MKTKLINFFKNKSATKITLNSNKLKTSFIITNTIFASLLAITTVSAKAHAVELSPEMNDLAVCVDLTDFKFDKDLAETSAALQKLAQNIKDMDVSLTELLKKDRMDVLKNAATTMGDNVVVGAPQFYDFMSNLQFDLLGTLQKYLLALDVDLSFKARASVLPKKTCDALRKTQINNINMMTQEMQKEIKVIQTSGNAPAEIIINGVSPFHTQASYATRFNLNDGYQTLDQQTAFQLVALNVNMEHTKKGVGQYVNKISGGVVISLPPNFVMPLEQRIKLTATQDVHVKNAYFEQHNPGQNHFVSLNFDNVQFDTNGLLFDKDSVKDPIFDLYFTDQITAYFNTATQYITFVATYGNGLGTMMAEIIPGFCEEVINGTLRVIPFCRKHLQINSPISHLVMELNGYNFTNGDTESTWTLPLPKLRLPDKRKGENGGVSVLLRLYTSDYTRFKHKAFFSFLLNEVPFAMGAVHESIDKVNQQMQNAVVGSVLVAQHFVIELEKSITEYKNCKMAAYKKDSSTEAGTTPLSILKSISTSNSDDDDFEADRQFKACLESHKSGTATAPQFGIDYGTTYLTAP